MRSVLVSAGAMAVPAVAVLVRTPSDRVAVAIAVGLIAVANGAVAAALRRPGFLGAAAVALGCEYAISLASRGREIDPLAPVIALLVYGAVEVAGFEIDVAAVRATRRAITHHLGVLARVGLAAWIACLVVMGGAVSSSSDGTTVRVVGAASAGAAVVLLGALARRSRTLRARSTS
jgi:hypothetical protein